MAARPCPPPPFLLCDLAKTRIMHLMIKYTRAIWSRPVFLPPSLDRVRLPWQSLPPKKFTPFETVQNEAGGGCATRVRGQRAAGEIPAPINMPRFATDPWKRCAENDSCFRSFATTTTTIWRRVIRCSAACYKWGSGDRDRSRSVTPRVTQNMCTLQTSPIGQDHLNVSWLNFFFFFFKFADC